jgi:hypothetical protein
VKKDRTIRTKKSYWRIFLEGKVYSNTVKISLIQLSLLATGHLLNGLSMQFKSHSNITGKNNLKFKNAHLIANSELQCCRPRLRVGGKSAKLAHCKKARRFLFCMC